MYLSFHLLRPTSVFSFLLVTLHLLLPGANSAVFTLINKCNYAVWPAALTTSTNATLPTTGLILKSGKTSTVTAPDTWSGRFWGRTDCNIDSVTGKFSCVTGNCGSEKLACNGKGPEPPTTLAQFSLSSEGGLDFYNVSVVDGFNVPILVVPVGGSGENCSSTGCPVDLNNECPTNLRVYNKSKVVGCQGACSALKLKQFCCVGKYSSPKTCELSSYSLAFKRACPDAYSYPYDYGTKTFSCSSESYNIIFCPFSKKKTLFDTLFRPFVILISVSVVIGIVVRCCWCPAQKQYVDTSVIVRPARPMLVYY